MEVLERIKEKIANINKQKQELTEELRKEFAPMFEPLFEKSEGKITSIGWTQYSPYFNDGNDCTFSVRLDYLHINGDQEDDIDSLSEEKYVIINQENEKEVKHYLNLKGYKWMSNNTLGQSGYLPNENYDNTLADLVNDFKEVLSSIDDEFYQDLFGNHVLVTVYADGRVETEEYEHD